MDLPYTPTLGGDVTEMMCWRRTFAGHPDQAARARHFVDTLLANFTKADEVAAVVGELVCNAVQHTHSALPGGLITLEVRQWPGDCVTICVTDQGGHNQPRPQPIDDASLLEEHGRGLRIVNATATRWGWTGDVRGRAVTALFLG